jgi:SAM-dependent methyltransferase
VTDREAGRFSLNDFGCGYGALVTFLGDRGLDLDYRGFDLSESMLKHARREHEGATFVGAIDELEPADFTVASGIFNVKLDVPVEDWRAYVLDTIRALAGLSTKGFAFNMLTSYSDQDRMRDDLYYGDPRFFFDLCKRLYSQQVALLHDYGLYEFTCIVRLGE